MQQQPASEPAPTLKKVENAPASIELAAMDQPPDAESMTVLRTTVAAVVQALRNGHQRNVYELLAPEIRRAVPFYEFLERFRVRRDQVVDLPDNLPEPDFSRVRDRVADVFIMKPGNHTSTAIHLDLVRIGHRWLLRTLVVYHAQPHSFHNSGGLMSPGTTQQDLFKIKEAMLQKVLMTGKDWGDPDGFPGIKDLNRSIPIFVETDLDLPAESKIHVPGWTVQVVSEDTAVARSGRKAFFTFGSIQVFGDLVLGTLRLSHPDFTLGGGGGEMWLVRTGSLWRFYKHGPIEIS